jgi:D-alanyl-D-alanine carboxypeptidase/D-alanyl-D-alanine-endopeptidase (penicillin-binding protein 4)
VASIESAPLADVVGVMLRESDNLAAELLVKELGVRFGGRGSTEAGLGVIRQSLTTMGLAGDGLAAADGSGLDRSDRLTCELLEATLTRAGDSGPLANGFPVAGRDGTLATRMRRGAARRRCRAKTGTLSNVSALSGYCTARSGDVYAFSILMNGVNVLAARHLQDRMAQAMAASTAPAPVSPTP